ncbi:MAG: TcpQ domain-containing protein [Alphaproteobacteria bacterium]|nr:TcpQ domain-containing protein [Alphaproteobacteria bacterium]
MLRASRSLMIACAFAALFAAADANAGFQWTAPAAGVGATSSQTAAPSAAPLTPIMSETLPGDIGAIQSGGAVRTTPDGPASAAPIYGNGMTDDPITWNTPHQARAQAQISQPTMQQTQTIAPRAPQETAGSGQPTSLYALASQPAQPTSEMSAAGYNDYSVAEGFGRDLPLVMAIRQIVPSSYGFVFDDGIDVNSHVSWQGGKPWDIVLQETLSPLNLGATIRGNVVTIARRTGVQSTSNTPANGPAVMTETVMNSNSMPMTPLPVAAVSAPAVPDDMSGGIVQPAAATSATLNATTTWTAPRNSTLRGILEDWSERVGVELYWASEYDYPIKSGVKIQGTFEEAVQTLLKGLSESRPRPLGRLHPNLPEGPAVLVIETRQSSM